MSYATCSNGPGERPVAHRSVEPTPAIGIEQTVERDDILAWWQGALGELQATARGQRLTPSDPSGGLYAAEIFQHGAGPATVFIPTQGPLRPVGRVQPLVVPAAELAVMRHDGPLYDIDITYGELGGYVMRHEISVDGALRENYLRGFLDREDPLGWQTEIAWPIFRSDAAEPQR